MEEVEQGPKKHLPDDMYYNYEELHSKPLVTPGCEISENLLYLWYPAQIRMTVVVVVVSSHHQMDLCK